MKIPQFIVIHHTAVSWKKNPDQANATNNYHKNKIWGYTANKTPIRTPVSSLGFYGGYNYEIAADGKVTQFRKDGETTVAQYQQNMNDGRAISICIDGFFDLEDPTPEQRAALKTLVSEKMAFYGIPSVNIFPHRHFAIKTCPGTRIPNNVFDYIMAAKIETPDWAKKAVDAAINAGIITNADNLEASLSASSLETIFVKAGIFEKKEGSISLMRLLVALDRLGALPVKK